MKAPLTLIALLLTALSPVLLKADEDQPSSVFRVHIAGEEEASTDMASFSPTPDLAVEDLEPVSAPPAPQEVPPPNLNYQGEEVVDLGADAHIDAAPMSCSATPASLLGQGYQGEMAWADYCCESCYCAPRGWFEIEYLLWQVQEQDLPPLVTSSPDNTPRDEAGVLGQPGTTILFGGNGLDEDPRSGARIRFGGWLDDCGRVGVEGVLFGLEGNDVRFQTFSQGDPILARPIFNVDPNVMAEDAVLVAFDTQAGQDVFDGGMLIQSSSEISSAEALIRTCAGWYGAMRVDLLSGYRYFQLDEGINIFQSTTSLDPAGPAQVGTTIETFDSFSVENDFHGGELGLSAHQEGCRWTFDMTLKVALGRTRSNVSINGGTLITEPNGDETNRVGGVLALDDNANIGNYEQSQFSVLPEANVKIGYRLTRNLTGTLGYTFLYINKVGRPGEQIDTTVNGTLLSPTIADAGMVRPRFDFNHTDLWAQGLTAGLTLTY